MHCAHADANRDRRPDKSFTPGAIYVWAAERTSQPMHTGDFFVAFIMQLYAGSHAAINTTQYISEGYEAML